MEISVGTQILSSAGAAMILLAYVGHQFGWMDPRKPAYNLLNAAGAAVLTWIALAPLQVGFVALEGVWTLVSVWGLWRAWRYRGGTVPSDN